MNRLIDEGSTATLGDVGKKLAALWKDLDETNKQVRINVYV